MPNGEKVRLKRDNSALVRSLRITALYFLFGTLWIIFTEMAVIYQLGMFSAVSAINIAKGMLYVLLTSALIFVLVYSGFKNLLAINNRLQKSEATLLDAQRLAHIGSYDYDALSGKITCTEELLRILGIASESFHGDIEMILSQIHPEDRRLFTDISAPETSGNVNIELQCRVIRPDGEERVLSVRVVRTFGEHGAFIRSSGTVQDITELKQMMNHLRESERSKSVLLSNLPGMAFRCQYSRKRTMHFISDGCYALTGYQPEAFLSNHDLSYDVIICDEYRERMLAENADTLARRVPFKYEYEIITATGGKKWVLETSQGVYNAQGEVEAIEGIIVDITESKRRSLQIEYMNDHDALTGLYNRPYFEEAKSCLDREGMLPLAIILTDINSLKLINDAFGIESGDRMIRKAADILKACCGENDVLARTGGDEFSILAPNAGHQSAEWLITSIRAAFELYNTAIADKTQVINLSIAFSVKEQAETGMTEVIKQAEDSLSRQKLLDKRSHHNAMLASIMATMYERSFETEEHAERIAQISIRIGSKMNLQQRQLDELHLFSMLHDIGKIGIHDQILKKPGKLTDEEWSEMRKHPEIGYRIAMSTPELSTVAEYILTHHERWDGKGYPRGISGLEIPLLSRILAVADAYDAMTEDRVYHKGMPKEQAIEEIRQNAGTQFDPAIVDVFEEVIANP